MYPGMGFQRMRSCIGQFGLSSLVALKPSLLIIFDHALKGVAIWALVVKTHNCWPHLGVVGKVHISTPFQAGIWLRMN